MAKRKSRTRVVNPGSRQSTETTEPTTSENNSETDANEGAREWEIRLTPTCVGLLKDIKDARVRKSLADRIDLLQNNPDLQGKQLHGELRDFRSIRAVGQRYRIIYKVEEDTVVVIAVSLGIRKEGDKSDIYALTKKLLRLGLLAD
jgi:mRNA interferase RelE/StbE